MHAQIQISPLDHLDADQVALFKALEDQGIETVTYDHPAVFTMAESDFLKEFVPGTHCRSLLLTNKTGRVWLVSAADETKIDLKYLSDQLATPRFSFAKAETMTALLRVTPGSLTPFAALFAPAGAIEVILDEGLMQQDRVVFHPLRNTQSTVIKTPDLARFITGCGHHPRIMALSPLPAHA